jgi:hypothetical protein
MEGSQKGVYMPDSYILGIQSNGEDIQKRVLLRPSRPRGQCEVISVMAKATGGRRIASDYHP